MSLACRAIKLGSESLMIETQAAIEAGFDRISEFRHGNHPRFTTPISLGSGFSSRDSSPSLVIQKILKFCQLGFPLSRPTVLLGLPYREWLSLACRGGSRVEKDGKKQKQGKAKAGKKKTAPWKPRSRSQNIENKKQMCDPNEWRSGRDLNPRPPT